MTGAAPEIEAIESSDGLVAFVIRATVEPAATTFVTPDATTMQAGFIVYPQGGDVPRHLHKPLPRSIVGTSEVLLVRKGACEVDLYDDNRHPVATRRLGVGDVIVLLAGGHAFRMLEDTILLEIKQGPYTGLDEKERF